MEYDEEILVYLKSGSGEEKNDLVVEEYVGGNFSRGGIWWDVYNYNNNNNNNIHFFTAARRWTF